MFVCDTDIAGAKCCHQTRIPTGSACRWCNCILYLRIFFISSVYFNYVLKSLLNIFVIFLFPIHCRVPSFRGLNGVPLEKKSTSPFQGYLYASIVTLPLAAPSPHCCIGTFLEHHIAILSWYVAPAIDIASAGNNCAIASAQYCLMRACSYMRVRRSAFQSWYVALARVVTSTSYNRAIASEQNCVQITCSNLCICRIAILSWYVTTAVVI